MSSSNHDARSESVFGGLSPTSRLAAALRLSLAYRKANRTDADAFLAEHPDLADLLLPMITGSGESVADAAAENLVPADRLPAAGRDIDGYLLQHELGRGGMGVVYAAVQTSLGRHVALKLMAPEVVSERMQRRFVREAAILGRLEHDHIVRVLDAGIVQDGAYLALELIDGASLAAILEAVRRAGLSAASGATVAAALLGAATDAATTAAVADGSTAGAAFRDRSYVDTIVTLSAQVADALGYAHARGVVHRDVKPSNILVRRDGRAVLSDFGVARDVGLGDPSQSNPLAGTPTSMAPEQVVGGRVDARTDVYGLGATLYEALTLTPPFIGSTAQVLARICSEEPPDPRQHHPRLPADLAAIVGKAMAKLPAERYADAAALARDLRAFLARAPIEARVPGTWLRLRRFARQRPWRAAALSGVAAALLAALLVAGVLSLRLAAQTRRKNTALAEVERLGMNVVLDGAISAATAFAHPRSEGVAAMSAWLQQRAQPLADALPSLQALLANVRARAEPYAAADAEVDRRTHPEADALQRLEYEVELARSDGDATALAAVSARRDEVAARVGARRTWRFAQAPAQFLHDQVAALVGRLQAFTAPGGCVQRVRAACDFVLYARQRSLVDGAAAWTRAIADIDADPRYRGVHLQADEEILPLGRDPHSGLWEFVHLRSGTRGKEVPARGDDGSIRPDDDMGIVLVLVPAGTSTMGAQATDPKAANYDPDAGPYEAPVQDVALDAFWIGKYEVTIGQWFRLTGERPSPWRVGETVHGAEVTARYPVCNLAYTSAIEGLSRYGLTLPTEAQWECACRAGTSSPWSFGTRDLALSYANCCDVGSRSLATAMTMPVGSLAANPFGLHDVHGNVREWCDSLICLYGERKPRPGDGQRPTFMFDERRYVTRGGAGADPLKLARSSDRWSHADPDNRSAVLGVRACRLPRVRR